jgi:hypothetical protein
MKTTNHEAVYTLSPLLSLPAEIRVMIYKLVLAGKHRNIVDITAGKVDIPALLHTSRLIRHEAVPIFYNKTNTVFMYLIDESDPLFFVRLQRVFEWSNRVAKAWKIKVEVQRCSLSPTWWDNLLALLREVHSQGMGRKDNYCSKYLTFRDHPHGENVRALFDFAQGCSHVDWEWCVKSYLQISRTHMIKGRVKGSTVMTWLNQVRSVWFQRKF